MTTRPMLEIPVSAAKDIADRYGYDQVVIIARRVGEEPEPHCEHVTTYGRDKAHCGVAARVGNFIKHKIMGWPEYTPAPQAQADARDAAFEAVRKKFCKLQRYSFFLDDKGNVRRTPDYCGNWVEFEAVHTLFEPGAVDAAIAAQAAQQGEKQ